MSGKVQRLILSVALTLGLGTFTTLSVYGNTCSCLEADGYTALKKTCNYAYACCGCGGSSSTAVCCPGGANWCQQTNSANGAGSASCVDPNGS